jgi:hypothetical protein
MPEFNTKTRCDFLETGFWVLTLYDLLEARVDLPPGIVPKKDKDHRKLSLYSKDQLRDGQNTFASLLSTKRTSPTPICLNRVSSDPLEHSFGHARIRCKDVNTMDKMLKAFSYKAESIAIGPFLDLLGTPRRRHSMGITCEAWSVSTPSELVHTPFEIAVSLFDELGIGLSRVLNRPSEESLRQCVREPRAWHEFKTFKAFSFPLTNDSLCGTVFMSFFGQHHERPGQDGPVGVLSSDQLFLGIVNSPRAVHLITSPSRMGKVPEARAESRVEPGDETVYDDRYVESRLREIFGRNVPVRDIELLLPEVERRIGVARRHGRKPDDYLVWMKDNSPRIMDICQEIYTDRPPGFQ